MAQANIGKVSDTNTSEHRESVRHQRLTNKTKSDKQTNDKMLQSPTKHSMGIAGNGGGSWEEGE